MALFSLSGRVYFGDNQEARKIGEWLDSKMAIEFESWNRCRLGRDIRAWRKVWPSQTWWTRREPPLLLFSTSSKLYPWK